MESKVVVITGASSGIGAALARRLGRDGHRLALAARRPEALAEVAHDVGDGALTVVTDVTRRSDVERLRDQAIAAFDHVDVWVNNAGRGIHKPALELTDDDVDEMIAVNLKSALYGMQAIVPHFKERGHGHVINVSSFLGRVPLVTFRSAYSASKAALNALTANVRVDLAAQFPDVRVSLVMPGVVATDFHRNASGAHAPSAPPLNPRAGVQSAEEVAEGIAELIANPVAELYTNPASHGLVRHYYEDVAAFESGGGRS